MDDKQQEILEELRRVAELLNSPSLTRSQFRQHGAISVATVQRRFGSWNRAIKAAGLSPNTPPHLHGEPTLSEDALLQDIIRVSVELGKVPTADEMSAFGRFSRHPYYKRWGNFSGAVKAAYAKYGVPSGVSVVTESVSSRRNKGVESATSQSTKIAFNKTYTPSKKTQYGEAIDFRGLRHAPLNEQGVVYMFGMVSRELGFLIEAVRTGYPDCLGKRRVNKNPQRWEDVRIEFEFKSSNFDHNPDECDLIVCWLHDWSDCPLEVIELKSEIESLPNAIGEK